MIIKSNYKTYILLNILILFTNFLYSQTITKQLRVIRGGNIPFVFNSIDDYKNGKSLGGTTEEVTTGWTRFYISFTDTIMVPNPPGLDTIDGPSTGWELVVKAYPDFLSDGGNDELSLDSLKIITKAGVFTNSTVTTYNQTLGLVEKVIATGTDPGEESAKGEIELSFHFFMKLGKQPDYYFTDLIFTLREKY